MKTQSRIDKRLPRSTNLKAAHAFILLATSASTGPALTDAQTVALELAETAIQKAIDAQPRETTLL